MHYAWVACGFAYLLTVVRTPDGPAEGLAAVYQAWRLSNSWNHVEAQIWRPRRSGILRKKGAYNSVAGQFQSHFHPRLTASSVHSRMERLRFWMRVPVCVWSGRHRQVCVNWSMCFRFGLHDCGVFIRVRSCNNVSGNSHLSVLPICFCRSSVFQLRDFFSEKT